MPSNAAIWQHLQQLPMFWLWTTLLIFYLGTRLQQRCKGSPWINPTGISIVSLVLLLSWSHVPYAEYFRSNQLIHGLLAPATVALAVPLYQQLRRIQTLFVPLLLSLLIGSCVAIILATGSVWLFGGSHVTLLSLAPKSATTAVSMGISEKIGGIPSLTAAVVILTGVLGAIVGPLLLNVLGIHSPAIRGFALGVISHGNGTARAFQEGETCGAFAGLGMGLNALMTALLIPIFMWLVGW